jgi:hypothetical protein
VIPNPSTGLELGFIALTLLVAAAVVALVRRVGGPAGRVGLGIALVLAASYALGWSGVLADATPPKPLLVLVPAAGLALWFALRSRSAELLAARASLAALIGLQAFRLPLELLMHGWAAEGALPPQMTFAGYNFDIVTGVLALLVAPLADRGELGRRVALMWNVVGLALLLTIIGIAITSLPGPLNRFPGQIPNVLVMRAPYIWLAVFLAAEVALAGHIIVFRALRRRA